MIYAVAAKRQQLIADPGAGSASIAGSIALAQTSAPPLLQMQLAYRFLVWRYGDWFLRLTRDRQPFFVGQADTLLETPLVVQKCTTACLPALAWLYSSMRASFPKLMPQLVATCSVPYSLLDWRYEQTTARVVLDV